MEVVKFEVPKSVTVNNFNTFYEKYCKSLSQIASETKKVIICFKQTEYLEPILIAFIAAQEDILKSQGIELVLESNLGSKLEKILKAFGLIKADARFIVEAYERNMNNCALKIQRVKTAQEGLDVVKKILPQILRRIECNQTVTNALDWALWEMIDNAGNHGYKSYDHDSYQGTVYVCSFAYVSRVELVVLDLGQGIYNSLRSVYPDVRESEMLEFATRKGITGNPNGSAGFGLHGSSNIAKLGGGSLYIISGGNGLKITDARPRAFSLDNFNGTLVSIGLKAGANFALDQCIGKTDQEYIDMHGLEV